MSGLLNRFCRIAGMIGGRVSVGHRTHVNWWRLRGIGRSNRVQIGADAIVHCRIDFDDSQGLVLIGDRCYIGASHLVCHSRIEIGSDVIMSWGVTVVDHDSHSIDWERRRDDVALWRHGKKDWSYVTIAPVVIEDKVWIGFGASILKGVRVGQGAVVGANSVVTKNIPPYCVVAGNPARIVRRLINDDGAKLTVDEPHTG